MRTGRNVNKNRNKNTRITKEIKTSEEKEAEEFHLAGSGAVYLWPSVRGWCTSHLHWGPLLPPAKASPP